MNSPCLVMNALEGAEVQQILLRLFSPLGMLLADYPWPAG